MALAKDELLAALHTANIARVWLVYSGDSGESFIEGARLYAKTGELVGKGEDQHLFPTLHDPLIEQLYAFVNEQLSTHSPGWEIDEGGTGTVEIDVELRTVRFDHGLYAKPVLVAHPFEL